jgi:outer membrane biosynthesis protein TonB
MSTSPSPSPNPSQKPEHFDLYARKFAAICEMHSIKTGSSDDLEGFLEKLESDRHFAMDFWGLAGKLSAREGGELSDEQMLALVVEGVTGKPLPNGSEAALDPTLSLLRAMVAGVDVQRPAPTPPARTAPVEPIDEARSRLASTEEQRKRFSAGLASMPQPAEPEPNPTPLPSQLQLALQSLELVSRDLDNHLHKIEQRLSGLEVKVKKQAARADLPIPMPRDPTGMPSGRPQLSLHPAVLTTTEERRIYETAPSGRDTNWRKNVRLAVVFLSGLAVIFCLNYYSPLIRQQFHAIVREDLESPAGSIWDRDTRPPALLPPRSATVSTPPQLPQSVSSPPLETSKPASLPKEAPDHALARTEEAITYSPGAIKVAAAEMERRLTASRVPIYPQSARLEGVEGTVVAQALISKLGAVTRVHVISGDPRLLSAATEAMYQRHYRPYLLNGTPVEVSTTIAVNFKLNG